MWEFLIRSSANISTWKTSKDDSIFQSVCLSIFYCVCLSLYLLLFLFVFLSSIVFVCLSFVLFVFLSSIQFFLYFLYILSLCLFNLSIHAFFCLSSFSYFDVVISFSTNFQSKYSNTIHSFLTQFLTHASLTPSWFSFIHLCSNPVSVYLSICYYVSLW